MHKYSHGCVLSHFLAGPRVGSAHSSGRTGGSIGGSDGDAQEEKDAAEKELLDRLCEQARRIALVVIDQCGGGQDLNNDIEVFLLKFF